MKIDKIHKNFIKSLCINFWHKIFGYSHYLYWLKKELTHFGLKLSTIFRMEVSRHFEYKNY